MRPRLLLVHAVLLSAGLVSLTSGATQFFLPLFPAKYLPTVVGTGAGLGAVALLKLKSVAAVKAYTYLRDSGAFDYLDTIFDPEEAGWGSAGGSSKNAKSSKEAMEKVLEYDKLECGYRLMCELSTRSEKELKEEEKAIMALYGSEDKLARVDADSLEKISYMHAAHLGKGTKDPLVCASVYYQCPHDAGEIMKALKAAAEY